MVVTVLFGSSWDPGIPAQMQHSVYAEDLKTGKSAARPFLMGFPGGPWAPLIHGFLYGPAHAIYHGLRTHKGYSLSD